MHIRHLLLSALLFSAFLHPGADDPQLLKKALRIHQPALTVDLSAPYPFFLFLPESWAAMHSKKQSYS